MKNSMAREAFLVCKYTLKQHYRGVSTKVFLVILFLLSLAAFPVLLLTREDGIRTSTDITKIYLRNETDISLELSALQQNPIYQNVSILETKDSNESIAKKFQEEPYAVLVVLTMDESEGEEFGYHILGLYGENSALSSEDVTDLTEQLEEVFHQSQMKAFSVTQEQLDFVGSKVYTQVQRASQYGKPGNETDSYTYSSVSFFYCYLILFLTCLSMGYIFQSCMEEKVSKLIETLLVSVRPTAILVGKILSVTIAVFLGIGGCLIGLAISYGIASQMGNIALVLKSLAKSLNFDLVASPSNALHIVLIVVSVLLAYFLFAFISGIAGSTCSKAEDTQQSVLYITLFICLFYILATFVPTSDSELFNRIASLVPFTAIFIALPSYLCGRIDFPFLCLSLLLQLATVIFFARLAGKVYYMMIFYRGNVPKPMQIIKMMRNEHRATKARKEQAK